MKHQEQIERLIKLRACSSAVKYAKQYKSSRKAWDDCDRGEWMLWYLGKLAGKPESKSRKKLVLCASKCARLSLKYVSRGEKRPLRAIETAEGWAFNKGGVTLGDVRAAADAAYAASAANTAYAAASAAASAASAAASAAYAASAADAAYAAASAAASAAYAASAADAKTQNKCAKIVREFYPKPPN